MNTDPDDLLRTQREYYRARSGEYDAWFERRGRYDRGPELNAAWFEEIALLRQWVDGWVPRGRVLELAAGTGLWTEWLARRAARIHAIDASEEVLSLNRARLDAHRAVVADPLAPVEWEQADLFAWRPRARYDAVFFGFWLSHVPPERFDAFWRLVDECLEPGGRVAFVDSRYEPTSTARDHRLEGVAETTVLRRLDDGREFRIVKVFHRAAELTQALERIGWMVTLRETPRYFLYGEGTRA